MRLLISAFILTCAAAAFGQSAEPVLRIETETHTGAIGRIALAKSGRLFVTASEDKTVRVWERPSGRLLKILRPPIGSGNEGKLFGLALSPDGKTVACGGWTGVEWDKSASVYLFDRESGALLKRITGIPNTIIHMAYSDKGDKLAVALGGKGGIRLFSTSTMQQIGVDSDYAESANYVEVDSGGRIVACSEDGFIRLYDSSLKLLRKVKGPNANRPVSCRFSPDGKRIAVGYGDKAAVDVLSGKDLSLEYSPEADVHTGTFGNVAWSPDGKTLFGGGSFRRGPISVRKWADGGKGPFSDIPAASNTISDMVGLDSGGVLLSSFGGEILELAPDGKKGMQLEPAVIDNRLNQRRVAMSADGAVIRFLSPALRKTVAFSVTRREYLPYAQIPQTTYANTYKAPLYTEGIGERGPVTVGGKRVALDAGELCYSGAVTNDAQKALLGTSWALRLFDGRGLQLWKADAPSVVFSLNVTADGKTAMAAFGDGTYRWYRLSDGREMLAFLPHSDGKRWILWTPDGRYDCAPGSESLIGWHVNNGKARAADFYPASRFRKKYYRPELMAAAIGLKDEGPKVAAAEPEPASAIQSVLPPIVRIVSPSDGASVNTATLTVRYSVRAPSGQAITRVRAMVDGRPVADSRNLSITAAREDESVKEIQIQIPSRDCEVGILAENQHAISEPSTVRVRWSAGQNPQEFSVKPKLYILAIGVSKYRNPDFRLEFAAKDAADFALAMTSQQGRLYREVVSRVLVDDKASRDEILDGLEWIQKQVTSRDVAMVFLSGHGILDTTRAYYYAPVGIELDKLRRTGLPFTEIKSTVEALAGKALFFVDTCHAGNAIGTTKGAVSTDSIVNELASAENGAVVFCSSTGRQLSLEKVEWGNGAFTKALIEGLTGKADVQKTGRITVNMLDFYISERVKELTGGSQTPATAKPATVPDFPIAATTL